VVLQTVAIRGTLRIIKASGATDYVLQIAKATMTKCDHLEWVEMVEGKPAPLLAYNSRFARVVGELSQPSAQFPDVVFLMGRRLKDKALRQLCRSGYRGQHRHQQSVNLRADNRTLRSQHPRLFADSDPTCRALSPAFESPQICHPHENIPVEWPSTEYTPHDLILVRLLFLFVDVLCIFADDVGGLDVVKGLLSTWARIGSASSLPRVVRPRVMVVVGGQTKSVTQSFLDEEDFLFHVLEPDGPPLFSTFADIQTYRLPPDELSPDARFLQLNEDVSTQLRKARQAREDHMALFTATHMSAFFEDALQQMSRTMLSPFNFVRSSRRLNPLDESFTSHLTTFLSLGNRTRLPYEGMTSFVASAILMDAYPPGMHGTSLTTWILHGLTH
jgi:hypothetical protein